VISLWSYTDLDHRAKVRRDLASDKEWMVRYMDVMRPMVLGQQSVILNQVPWWAYAPPQRAGSIFELRNYLLRPGAVPKWEEEFQKGIAERAKLSAPVLIWFSEFGFCARVFCFDQTVFFFFLFFSSFFSLSVHPHLTIANAIHLSLPAS
jgi:hypothetical protein